MTPGPAPDAISHRTVLVVFSGLLLVLLLAALDSTIVATALPTIVGELGGLERLSWVITAYLLAQTIATPLYGKLGDLYGRKLVLQAAVVLFLAGSALCGASRSMLQLILFRALQGLGGGAALAPAARAAYAAAFTQALSVVFLVATAIALAGFALAWLLPERPLRETVAAAASEVGTEMGEAFTMPRETDAIRQLVRGLRCSPTATSSAGTSRRSWRAPGWTSRRPRRGC